jgi:hypothetical protein
METENGAIIERSPVDRTAVIKIEYVKNFPAMAQQRAGNVKTVPQQCVIVPKTDGHQLSAERLFF